MLSDFHPAVARWFDSRFAMPTSAQRRGWSAIRSGQHTLIAAPTGSGKTLAAFLASLDDLLRQGLAGGLPDATQIVYVSPLRALSNDIHKNLAEPRREIRRLLKEMGYPPVEIRAAVRTGDTPSSERQAMIRRPPHILVTTPESLYLLLTAERSRRMLQTARTVIVDEIHALADDRRGSHLALSLERLARLAGGRLTRVGLSATQRPIEEVARFLVGVQGLDPDGRPRCTIIDEGHVRELDLAIEIPDSPLEAVMSGEVWEEVYNRIADLIAAHRTTLVFVNTRRLAERATRHLAERLGEGAVMAHHGSLSRDMRLEAERRLKAGELRGLVATASLELGIDIGTVDLVCQVGAPRTIRTFLQRVGRSGHTLGAVPRGRLFPLSRDELVEAVAVLRSVRRSELDRLEIPEKPLDILAQQIVATVAAEDWAVDDLFELCRRAYPYRDLNRREFDEVVQMLADGFATRRGRRGAHVHLDEVNGRARGRRGARLAALTCGGAIPDTFDYSVVLEPTGTFLGTLNEDFAIESMPGDIFQLGNASWRILRVEAGRVRVEDAHGQPPTIPFWLGEAPSRSDELSCAVSELRADIEVRLADDDTGEAVEWVVGAAGRSSEGPSVPLAAARQLVDYLAAGKRALGVVPTRETVVLERFFDEAGGMQLVLHVPFGSRINRAWGLALRKRFCRGFNFELQAAATEDAVVLSLSTQHSFPLEQVFEYLRSVTVRELLIQAFLDAPMFPTRWRWNATRSLAVLRQRGGRRLPAQLQRMESEDLLAAVFPDSLACLENIAGDREIPDHPLVNQTIEDCLVEAMDIVGLVDVLRGIETGAVRTIARDTTEPSPLGHEVLNARPYAFLDDAPLEERRTQAVYTRRTLEPSASAELGALDASAIERVRDEVWPAVRDSDELHDALLTFGFLTEREGAAGRDGVSWVPHLEELAAAGRAARVRLSTAEPAILWTSAERRPEIEAIFPDGAMEPAIRAPESRRGVEWDRGSAIRELVRGRLELEGPITVSGLAAALPVEPGEIEQALLALEAEGFVLRGRFSPGVEEREWCERRLLARVHRYTLNRLRAEIEPVSAADFLRFLLAWGRVDSGRQASGPEGLAVVIEQLDGYELPAGAWEADVLAARLDEYDPLWLDGLCLSGRVGWGRLSPPPGAGGRSFGPMRSSPVALFIRENAGAWLAIAPDGPPAGELSTEAQAVLEALERRGALFFGEIVSETGLLATRVEPALGELVAMGVVNADSFAGLRALLVPSNRRRRVSGSGGGRASGRRRGPRAAFGVESAGRWSLFRRRTAEAASRERAVSPTTRGGDPDPEVVEVQARVLLRRYGVVFRRLLERETNLCRWRDLRRAYHRLEARGEIRGGRFVAGFSGEQFALPEAVGLLRSLRRQEPDGRLIAVSAADPLNLVGVITPGPRVPALANNRVVYRHGVPVAVQEAGSTHLLADVGRADGPRVAAALERRPIPPRLRVYLGRRS